MNAPVTLAVTDHVPMEEKARYEALVEELHRLFEEKDGFLSVDIERHGRLHQVEYTVVSRWSGAAAVKAWRQDKAILETLSRIETITGGPAQVVQAAGLGIWIDHAEGVAPRLPPALKRIALSVIAVYPVLILLSTLSAPFIGDLPQPLQVLIIVVVLSALLTWPFMPWLSKILRPWLKAK